MFAKRTGMVLAVGLLAVPVLAACDDDDGVGLEDDGAVRVQMVASDAAGSAAQTAAVSSAAIPLTAVSELQVTVTDVGILPAAAADVETAWISLGLTDPVTIDLLDLAASVGAIVLAQDDVPAGSYENLRLFFSDAQVVLSESVTVGQTTLEAGAHDLFIPSGEQTGLKLPSADFVVEEDDVEVVSVLIDVGASVRNITVTGAGQVILTPVLGVTSE